MGKWRHRFAVDRLDGLVDAPRPGAARTIGDDVIEAVIVETLETAPPDATHWSTRGLAAKHGISHTTVGEIWRACGLKQWREDSFKVSPDPDLVEKIGDLVALYMNPPVAAAVFAVDEKPQIQALNRTAPTLPMLPTTPARATHDYQRNGTCDLFAAIEIATGKVITDIRPAPLKTFVAMAPVRVLDTRSGPGQAGYSGDALAKRRWSTCGSAGSSAYQRRASRRRAQPDRDRRSRSRIRDHLARWHSTPAGVGTERDRPRGDRFQPGDRAAGSRWDRLYLHPGGHPARRRCCRVLRRRWRLQGFDAGEDAGHAPGGRRARLCRQQAVSGPGGLAAGARQSGRAQVGCALGGAQRHRDGGTAAGFVSLWPGETPRPLTSMLNLSSGGQTAASAAVVEVGADGTVNLYSQSGAHLVVDVTGWLAG